MERRTGHPRHKPTPRRLLVVLGAWCGVALGWAGWLALLQAGDVKTGNLLRDASEVGRVPATSGFFSTLGVMGWGLASGASLLVAWVLFDEGRRRALIYPLATGLLSFGLGFDDAFLVHEQLAPNRLGLSENVMLGSCVAVMALWVAAFRSRWDRISALLLGLTTLCFVASLSIDQFFAGRILYEDGFKNLAIWTFVAFCIREAARCLHRRESPAAA